MKELKCPKCGNVFQVDEADYASIVSQVKNEEFHQEVERRIAELHSQQEAEQKVLRAEVERESQQKLSDKDKQIGEKDNQIVLLKGKIETLEAQSKLELGAALVEKDREIAELKNTIGQNETNLKLALIQEQEKSKDAIRSKESKIEELLAKAKVDQAEAGMRENNIREQYENRLKVAQEQVDYYKDLKTKLSTKMVGETLEQHCSTQFNTLLRPILPNAYFEKDNDASNGSKGDFIFRDSIDGYEYISIMFEMKNEMEKTADKHKNDEFFKKLDSDRTEKHCEYAVLVSLLETDSELYNGGIVDVSHRYPKMYVIRPQFFIPLITLLVQTSRKNVKLMQELETAKKQSIDVTKFEERLNEFKDDFFGHAKFARDRFEDAINQIDSTIKTLQNIRDNLRKSDNYVRLAGEDLDGMTIRKLTWGNPTMKQKFEEAKALGANSEGPDDQ